MARGTLYHFFDNRRSVFLAVMDRALLEIDEQADPRPGENKLEFVDYVFKIEGRLAKVWRKHNHIVEFYESHKFDPDFDDRRRTEGSRSIEMMSQQLLSHYPDIGPSKARSISSTLLRAIYTGLDTIALYNHAGAAGFKREWRQMIIAYINSLKLP